MDTVSKLQIANILRNIARYSLLLLTLLVITFALLSGAEKYGGGLKGILKNSPNALPWLGLLLLVYVAWKWEWIGGLLITVLGLFLLYFFNFQGSHFYWSVFFIMLSIVALGVCFMLSSYLRKTAH
jgi:hypothetical protein